MWKGGVMTTSMARPAAVALAAAALALPACSDSTSATPQETAPATTTQRQATTQATTTEPAPEPITAAERRWLRQVEAYSERLGRAVARSGVITHATMGRSIRLYERCETVLGNAGNAGRFEPARLLGDRGCRRLHKAAELLGQAIAASEPGGFVYAGTPDEERFSRALSRATEATGNAQYDLQRGLERAEAIERSVQS
jgi:hypothetical protein